jgi:hypothetical protein
MTTAEIKKLLIDLGLTVTDLARGCTPPLSRAAVWKYFAGTLRKPQRRAELESQLRSAAHARQVALPGNLWPDPPAATSPSRSV